MTDTSTTPLTATRPVISDEGSNAHMLPASDDGSAGPVQLGFPINFFGTVFTSLYVNTNGNVTFRAPLYSYQPSKLAGRTPPIIAPFLADVDTRSRASGRVRYGLTTFEGRAALGINWLEVGYHPARTDKRNRFQLLLVDRSDEGFGDFDIVMNYDRMEWESGEAAGGHGGQGGLAASAGFSAGSGEPDTFFEFPGSRVNGALLDTHPTTGLIHTKHNSDLPGRHIFRMRQGRLDVGAKGAGVGRKLMPSAVLLRTGKVLAFGDFVPTTDLFNPATNEWEKTGDTNANRRRHTATLLPDGRVLVTGGDDQPASAEVYDPSGTGAWKSIDKMSAGRSRHTATLVRRGGRSLVLVAGGEDPSGKKLASAELYDPDTSTWKTTGPMRMARSAHTATRVLVNGREQVLVAGGETEGSGKVLNTAELYDPDSGTWHETGGMSLVRQSHTATALVDGRVLVAGGESLDFARDPSELYGTAEVYDPAKGLWLVTGRMTLPRRNHAAFALRTGQVVVCGGSHELTGYQDMLELYEPDRLVEKGLWRKLGSMQARREFHAGLQLLDGRILIVGGFTSPSDLQGTYELYRDPFAFR